ncbi:MAG: NAD-dependent epimerase/dehydratase family protein [Rhodobacteraceae bacterium]|nr:MAG: NAD-dependent epimerase/dehydratase family protein [Paracoccaceae bacterium]
MPSERGHVLLAGATGTIGRATCTELLRQGHAVTCLLRAPAPAGALPEGAQPLIAELKDPETLAATLRTLPPISAVISCMASRTGSPRDAWAVDHDAQLALLRAAEAAGAGQFILLSAICVQKPLLEFQRAKLAFETALQESTLAWSIIRPTAFFKSLSGQVARVQAGKPFLLFGDGTLTACKPISDGDLARYLIGCIGAPDRTGRILPIGGPGPALTPRAQGEMIFDLTGRPAQFRKVPVALMDAIIAGTGLLGRVSARMADKAEFARIGRYYATESMLVWDAASGRYDAEATPEFGEESLRDHYAAMLRGEVSAGLGDHSVF